MPAGVVYSDTRGTDGEPPSALGLNGAARPKNVKNRARLVTVGARRRAPARSHAPLVSSPCRGASLGAGVGRGVGSR